LRRTDVKRLSAELAEQHVLVADPELAARITHRGAAIAATTGLVKHQVAISAAQNVDQFKGGWRRRDSCDHRFLSVDTLTPGPFSGLRPEKGSGRSRAQKKPSAFGL
jgi:hypothetical protein